MFRKKFKVKTSTTVKGSERRRLRSLLETQYPSLSADDINSLIPSKSEMSQVKAMTHAGSVAMIYCSGDNPIFFQVEDCCYPTIYTLWKFPGLLPTVTTVPAVLEKIISGADLMAPGVVIDETTIPELLHLKANDICSVRIFGNKSPIAVGKAILSESELCTEGIKGKAVAIVHNYKDSLWLSGSQVDLPLIGEEQSVMPPNEKTNESEDVCLPVIETSEARDNEPSLSPLKLDNDESTTPLNNWTDITAAIPDTNSVDADISDAIANSSNTIIPCNYTMDEILFKSFMVAIKTSGKKIQLPILTSTFYRTNVLSCCPEEFDLHIKKTTYKKLSVFFKKMVKDSLVQVKELTKGVESIVSINTESEAVKSFYIEPIFKNHILAQKLKKPTDEAPTVSVQENYKFPTVTELYVISAQVKAMFEFSKIRKGETVTGNKVREVLKQYVKNQSLQNPQNPREVILDPILADCVLKRGVNKNSMTWDELYEALVSKMPHAYEIIFDEKESITKKGKLEPIDIAIDTRTGNKKVTLIQNLETYGINPEKLAQHVQVAVAASTSVTPTQSGKGMLVLIQGNQVRYLQKLFLEIYKVPKKYIRGLENVPGKKK